jgi:6-phosphogluconolactonase (cycloisomerase 2 family)
MECSLLAASQLNGETKMLQANGKRSFVGKCLVAAVGAALLTGAARADDDGAVYVLSNQLGNNSVIVFDRSSEGALSYSGSYSTGGLGTGPLGTSGAPFLDPLGSQDSLVLHSGFLFAVNAGSNDVSMFAVKGRDLVLLDKVPSGGQKPVSVAVNGFHVYVVNQGTATVAPNISGFTIDPIKSRLIPLAGSQRSLVGGLAANPAEAAFNADGSVLLVTEKGTNIIDSYQVDFHGYASEPASNPSSGSGPFGFSVTYSGFAFVSDSGGEAASSYKITRNGNLNLVSGPVSNGAQAAPCWLVTTIDGRFAYEANAGSSSIASFQVAPSGVLSLVNAQAAAIGAGLLDMALTPDSKYLYVRDGSGTVNGYQVARDGSLASVASTPTGSLPAGAQGIAAR